MIAVSAALPGLPACADDGPGTTIREVSDPGILPDSGFYFIKGWGRNFQTAFAADNLEKARLQLRFADEDALALKKLADEDKYGVAAGFAPQYVAQLQNAVRYLGVLHAQVGDNKTREMEDRLEQNYLRQQAVLASVLENAPEPAQEGLLNAISNSNRHIEMYILTYRGEPALKQYQEDVIQQTRDMGVNSSWKIQQRLLADHSQDNKPQKPQGQKKQGK